MVSIAILCGGKSSRFGKDKLFYSINGKPLYRIAYDKFKDLTDDIFLQGCNLKENGGIVCHQDAVRDKGPLGGIYSALMNAKHEKVFVMAADMPDVDPRILAEMKKYKEFKVVVPAWRSGYYEPLCAIYSKELIPILKSVLDQNILKVTGFYKFIENAIYIYIDELMKNGKVAESCFTNINTMNEVMEVMVKEV